MLKQILIASAMLMLIVSLSEGEMERAKIDISKPYALAKSTGEIDFLKNSRNFGHISIGIHGLNWSYKSQSSSVIAKDQDAKDGEFFGHINIPSSDGKRMIFNESINNIE